MRAPTLAMRKGRAAKRSCGIHRGGAVDRSRGRVMICAGLGRVFAVFVLVRCCMASCAKFGGVVRDGDRPHVWHTCAVWGTLAVRHIHDLACPVYMVWVSSSDDCPIYM